LLLVKIFTLKTIHWFNNKNIQKNSRDLNASLLELAAKAKRSRRQISGGFALTE